MKQRYLISSVLLSLLFAITAVADTKITQLPLGSAASSGLQSVFPYVDTTTNVTKKLKLSDLVNVPALAEPTFCTAKAITGFVSGAGTVSASDTILTALNKINGNIAAIVSGVTTVGTYNSQSAAANGATISGVNIYFQTGDATHPGMVSTGAQTIAGAKTFSSTIVGSVNGNAATVTTNANLTGPITSSGNATSVAAQTGTGSTFVMNTAPTLVTPVLGVASATTINKVALTAPATGSTLTIADGKTLTCSNSLTLAGTDSSTLNIGTGGTLGTAAFTNATAYEVPLTFSTGLTRTVNTVTVNTSQNIAKLTNLTSNGIVTTSAGDGTLSVTATNGSGNVVLTTSPTLVTPILGVAAATTINKVALTAPASGSTLTIADGKTLTSSNTLTLAGTDGSTLNVGTGGTLGTLAYLSDPLIVSKGGTGLATLTNHAIQIGAGTSTPTQLGPNASTVLPLVSGGSSADPSYTLLTVPGGGTGLATLTAHSIQLGNGTGTPTQLAVPASGTILQGVASSDPAFTATPTLGVGGTTAGTLGLSGVTSGKVTLATADAAGTWTFKLPTTAGTNLYVLQTDGSGNTSWVAQSGGGSSVNCAIYLTGGNGYGSTGTKIRRFTTVVTSCSDSSITYLDSATNGGTFTIATAGTYCFGRKDRSGSANYVGFSLNATSLTTNLDSLSVANGRLGGNEAGNTVPDLMWHFCNKLSVSDVIRAQDKGGLAGTGDTDVFMYMVRVN
jgi:hypothetical protein